MPRLPANKGLICKSTLRGHAPPFQNTGANAYCLCDLTSGHQRHKNFPLDQRAKTLGLVCPYQSQAEETHPLGCLSPNDQCPFVATYDCL